MIFLIKTTKDDISFIKDRVSLNGWSSVLYDTVFFVDVQDVENARALYDKLCTEDKMPASTIVVKLTDNEDSYYWGRADKSVWNWLKEHSRNK